MYLANLTVKGFRKISRAELSFRPALNIVLGENNAGKTAVIDGLRALLTTTEDGTLRLDETDLRLAVDGTRATEIIFSYSCGVLLPNHGSAEPSIVRVSSAALVAPTVLVVA